MSTSSVAGEVPVADVIAALRLYRDECVTDYEEATPGPAQLIALGQSIAAQRAYDLVLNMQSRMLQTVTA